MEFYHVVTERPMQVGQHILFDEEHHSGVYFRVMEKKKLVDEIYRFPEKYAGEELEHHTGNIFEGNANRCFDGTVDKEKNRDLARAYWKNDAKADEKHHPVVEVLVDGEIEVIDIIKDIDGIIN